ncbi:MAG: hypothetical protein PWP08_115 [Methanofollis sp.]|nr:hypothetical protein [Methanofollis sp.]
MVKITERRTKQDWALFLQDIAEQYSAAERITLVMDNLNTHTPGSLYDTYPPEGGRPSGTGLNSFIRQNMGAG